MGDVYEIASKLYVELSRDNNGHDLCLKYCHTLYDTIDFVLYQEDVPEIDLLSEISLYLTDRRESVDKDGFSFVYGEYKGYKVYINRHQMKINRCSLCRYYYGTNMHDFPLEDVRKAIERIGKDLHIPVDKLVVTRLDLAIDISLQRSPVRYFNRMLCLSHFELHSHPTGVSFLTKDKELVFYDKGVQQKSKIRENIARCEFRIKKVKKYFERPVTASMLYDAKFWNDLLDGFLSYYSKIKIERKPLPFDKINGVKSMLDCVLCDWIESHGIEKLISDLKSLKHDGGLTQRNYKSIIEKIKKTCTSLPRERFCSDMEEFDMKLKAFLISKRIN